MKRLSRFALAAVLCAAAFIPARVGAQNSDKALPPGAKATSPKLKAKFRKVKAEKKVPNQYIVVFNDDVEDVEKEAMRLIVGHGGSRQNQQTYGRALKGFSLWTSEAAARNMAEDPSVAFVEEDQVVSLSAEQAGATWGIDRIDQRDLPLSGTYVYNSTGAGVSGRQGLGHNGQGDERGHRLPEPAALLPVRRRPDAHAYAGARLAAPPEPRLRVGQRQLGRGRGRYHQRDG